MKKYTVKKMFEIAYAHRLQGHPGKCGNLHGHNAKIEVTVESATLDNHDMVIDFGEINDRVKKWLDKNLDHKTLLRKKDPLATVLRGAGQELFLTKENPTAEVLSRIIFAEISRLGIKAKKVKFWETDSSAASYKKA